jgi:hypothetical protein
MDKAITERFDPALRDRAKKEFEGLLERLELSENPPAPSHLLSQWAANEHPQGKKWYATWKRQDLLEKRDALARKQQAAGITGTFDSEARTDLANGSVPVPVKSPRHLALVHLPATASDEEFAQKWLAFEKNGARAAFIDETERLQKAGHSYEKSWEIASMTPPGKSHWERWQAAIAAEKKISP